LSSKARISDVDIQRVTGYATARDGVSLAYQLSGVGTTNLVWLPSVNHPIDLLWEEPSFARFAKRLGSFSRTMWGGGRGIGASGGNFFDIFDEESTIDDITTVLDAVGWERAVLVGPGMGAWAAIAFAAVHPERVQALVLLDGYAYYVREENYPIGMRPDLLDTAFLPLAQLWGSGASVEIMAPSRAEDTLFRETIARCERFGQPPHEMAEAVKRCLQCDVRHHLPAISVPTLVIHRSGDRFIRPEAGRFLADNIVGAKYVELPGEDHFHFVGDSDGILDELEEFLTGSRQGAEGDVAMAAILFTDIVSSTEQAARIGHRRWSALVDSHNAMVRRALERNRGREIKTLGDGFLVTFDASSRAVRAAIEVVAHARAMGIEVRAGVHTGEIEMRPEDVTGLAVNIAKRICDLAGPSEVLVSESVRPMIVDLTVAFDDRGEHELKGVPGLWRLFAVRS
jgi:class 3 adenylate cyclase/pimeloyl-ACP methyl ester carboxylesterase